MIKKIFGMFAFVLMISSALALQVPYDGLTLEWRGDSKFINHDYPSANYEDEINYIYVYSSMQDGKISQKSADGKTEEVIDIESREIISEGNWKGDKTSHWIDVNSKVGDNVKITEDSFFVKSTSDKVYLKDFGNVECIKVESKEVIDDMVGEDGERSEDMLRVRTIWYDKNTGLKLKEKEMFSFKHIFEYEYIDDLQMYKESIDEYELRENNIDNDKDGITDLQELLEYGTNPLEKDSDFDGIDDKEEIDLKLNPLNENTDGDWWIDGKDSSPLNKMKPLLNYVIGAVVLLFFGGIVFFISRKKLGLKK